MKRYEFIGRKAGLCAHPRVRVPLKLREPQASEFLKWRSRACGWKLRFVTDCAAQFLQRRTKIRAHEHGIERSVRAGRFGRLVQTLAAP